MDLVSQNLLLTSGGGKKSTYVDDVFSTYVYIGTNTSTAYNNGIDLAGEGGMVWIKDRDSVAEHVLFDTERGATKLLIPNDNYDTITVSNSLTSFNNNGFTLGNYSNVNTSGKYASWTFRKAKGFCDIVTWSGNGVAGRQISHSLGSIPGLILLKCTTSAAEPWYVYHRDLGATKYLRLNSNITPVTNSEPWNNTEPTSTNFTLAGFNSCNGSGNDYIAYLFAGGESNTDKAVDFDGNDFLSFANTSDFVFGTGAYTVEFFINPDTTPNGNIIFSGADTNGFVINMSGSSVNINKYSVGDVVSSTSTAPVGEWTHYAFVREGTGSNQTKIYVNGQLNQTGTDSNNWTVNANWGLGGRNSDGGFGVDGKISNFRITKGQAVYKHNFNVPHDPLTTTSQGANASNVKLLCCNGSTTTASTVTPGTITANGDPAVTTNNSIFDDPESFKFGEEGDQNIIRCGSYVGNTTTAPEIDLGWEPQFIIFKSISQAFNWSMFDSIRGMVTGGDDNYLYPNLTNAEASADRLELTPTGFKILTTAGSLVNTNNDEYIYIAIRMSDGLVGKPAEAGTDVFAMDTGSSSSTIPTFDSGFPVDFAFFRQKANADNWYTGARLMGKDRYLATDLTDAEGAISNLPWDSNVGYGKAHNSNNQAWMWKRHAGFDVVTYTGNGTWGREIPHSMGKAPEMMWVKCRNTSGEEWIVYHKGLDGGNAPETHYLYLDSNHAEADNNWPWNDTAPTATHFTLGGGNATNGGGKENIAFLFASVEGISKCGYYTGDGTNDGSHVITTGFQPRFIVIKVTDANEGWMTFDTVRGITAGNDSILMLNSSNSESSGNYLNLTSSGFDLRENHPQVNGNGKKYIYYAHA